MYIGYIHSDVIVTVDTIISHSVLLCCSYIMEIEKAVCGQNDADQDRGLLFYVSFMVHVRYN